MKLESEKFYQRYKDNKYICDKTIISWIKQNKSSIYKKIIDNGGIISKEIAKEVACIHFINKFYDEIRTVFNNNNFKIERLDRYNGIIVSTEISNRYKLVLSLALKEFVKKFSDIFYDDNSNINKEYILSRFNLHSESDNFKQLVIILNEIISGKYTIENVVADNRVLEEMVVKNSKNKEIKISMIYFYNKLSYILLKDKKEANIILTDYFKSFKNWKDYSKYNKKDIEFAMKNRKTYKDV